MSVNIEYVVEADTLADLSMKESTSASLRTSNAILLAFLLIAAYILNIILISTVLSSQKHRNSSIFLLLAHFSFIHVLDLTLSVLFSLIYVANGAWVLGSSWCRANAVIRDFCQMYSLLSLMLMTAERAVGIVLHTMPVDPFRQPRDTLFTKTRLSAFSLCLATISMAIAIPAAMDVIPVKPFRNRYLCAIDSNCPIGYPIARVIIYIGCLLVQLVCVGAILRKRSEHSLPSQSHEYSDFIRRNRAMKEHLSLAKLVILLLVVFVVVEGPYSALSLSYEICNSSEMLAGGEPFEIPQDADTLITWLKFVYPLLSPIIILSWCQEIWMKVKEIFCCRSYEPPTIGHYMNGNNGVPGVMTLVATPDGLQLKLPVISGPTYNHQISPAPNYSSVVQNSNSKTVPSPRVPVLNMNPESEAALPESREGSEKSRVSKKIIKAKEPRSALVGTKIRPAANPGGVKKKTNKKKSSRVTRS